MELGAKVAAPAVERAEAGAFPLIRFMGNEGVPSGPTELLDNGETES